jgi:hypothetical protein
LNGFFNAIDKASDSISNDASNDSYNELKLTYNADKTTIDDIQITTTMNSERYK